MSDEPRGSGRSGRSAMFVATAAALLSACGGTIVSSPPSAEDDGSTLEWPSDQGAAAVPPHADFRVTVRTERDRYAAGDEVTFTVETCNVGAPTTTEESTLPFGFTVSDDDGRVVADNSHVISTLALRITSWAAEECRHATGTWDQHHWNRPEDAPTEPPEVWGLPDRGDRVPPGRYRVSISSRYGSATSEPFTLEG